MKRLILSCVLMLGLPGFAGCGERPQDAQINNAVQQSASSAPTERVQPPGVSARSEQRVAAAPTGQSVSRFQEGIHYTRIKPVQRADVGPGRVEVVEMFWYGCGHCYAYDPAIESWHQKNQPEFVEFVRVPVIWGDVHRLHARAYYTAEMLGKLEQLHALMFREIHNKSNMLNSADKIRSFFKVNGVSEADFKRAFSSFGVETKLKRAEFLTRAYRVDSVPSFVVDGEFKTGFGEAGGEQQLFALLNELASRERGR